jgi:hypothetical protein
MLLLGLNMSAVEKLFFGNTEDTEIIRNLGIVPSPSVIRHITKKLHGFGAFGIQGFDMAVSTFAIMRGDDTHLSFQKNVDKVLVDDNGEEFIESTLQDFLYPFNFPTPSDEECTDHGLMNGYTYGLNVISRELPGVELLDYKATDILRVIAKDHNTDNYLVSKNVHNIPDSQMDFGYQEMPGNVSTIAGYLVLPKPEAIEIVAEAAISDYLV